MSDEDNVKELLDDVQLTAPWMDRLNTCPFCEGALEKTPSASTPDAGRVVCPECGFTAIVTAPPDMWDKRWATDIIIEI